MESLTQTISHSMEELIKAEEIPDTDLTALAESNKRIKDGTKPSNNVSVSYKSFCHNYVPTISHLSSRSKSLKEGPRK